MQVHILVRLDEIHEAGRGHQSDESFRRSTGAQQGQQEVSQELGGNNLVTKCSNMELSLALKMTNLTLFYGFLCR